MKIKDNLINGAKPLELLQKRAWVKIFNFAPENENPVEEEERAERNIKKYSNK